MTDQQAILAHVERNGAESAIRQYGFPAVRAAATPITEEPSQTADMPRPEIKLAWEPWAENHLTDGHVYWVANLQHAGFDVEVTVQRDYDGCTCRGDDLACLDNHPVLVVAADVSLNEVDLAHMGVGSVPGESYDRPGADVNAAATQMADEAVADARATLRRLVEVMQERDVI
jgi:hypothetical protein